MKRRGLFGGVGSCFFSGKTMAAAFLLIVETKEEIARSELPREIG